MLKKLIFLFVLSLGCLSAFTQPKGFKPVTDLPSFKKSMQATALSTQSIKCNFIQEKNLSVVEDKIISNGTFRFKKQSKVRMEYLKPFHYLLIINNDKVTIKDDQKTNSFSSRSNKLFTLINTIIMDCVQGTALDNKDFVSSVFTNEKNNLIILSPLKKELQGFFQSIHVYLDIKDGSVYKIDMLEPSGDNTVITFTDKEINGPLPDSEFNNN